MGRVNVHLILGYLLIGALVVTGSQAVAWSWTWQEQAVTAQWKRCVLK